LLTSDCPEAGIEQVAIDTLRERLRLVR